MRKACLPSDVMENYTAHGNLALFSRRLPVVNVSRCCFLLFLQRDTLLTIFIHRRCPVFRGKGKCIFGML